MAFLNFVSRISIIQDIVGHLKNLFMVFFSNLFLVCKSYSEKQNSQMFSAEYHPPPSLVSLPDHLITKSIKEELLVKEYSCFVERLGKEDHHPCCIVCFENLDASHKVREQQNCNHVFHKECLDAWIDGGHVTCPLCRAELVATDHGGESRPRGTGDPWRLERMIYLFGEDYLIGCR